MTEEIRQIRDSKGIFAAVLTDLSKAFDCILHELLLAKPHTYGLDKIWLTFVHAYLSQRQQKSKVGSIFSELMSILFDVAQGSILGSLLFIIYICDLFILIDHLGFGSYVDPLVYGEKFDEILSKLEKCVIVFKANAKKFRLFLSPFFDKVINIADFTINFSYAEVLLGITVDSNLSLQLPIVHYMLCQMFPKT